MPRLRLAFDLQEKPAFVPDGDGVDVCGLPEYRVIDLQSLLDEVRYTGVSSLLVHGPDNDQATGMSIHDQPRRRHYQGCEGPLRVDGSPAVESSVLEADQKLGRHGVHMPAQENPRPPLAVLPDHVADGVPPHNEPEALHLRGQKLAELPFHPRGAVDLDHPPEEVNRGVSQPPPPPGPRPGQRRPCRSAPSR